VKRIKLIIVTAVAMAVMVGAAMSPAWGQDEIDNWGWSDWLQWGNSNWWCSWLWSHHTELGWQYEQIFCYEAYSGEFWAWPEV